MKTQQKNSENERLNLFENTPIDKPFVRIEGPAFAKTGYLVWQPGLTLPWIEHEIGYNRKFGVPIAVSISRNHKKIYEKGATEWRRDTDPGAGQIKPKPDAPELKPGDIVIANRWLDF